MAPDAGAIVDAFREGDLELARGIQDVNPVSPVRVREHGARYLFEVDPVYVPRPGAGFASTITSCSALPVTLSISGL